MDGVDGKASLQKANNLITWTIPFLGQLHGEVLEKEVGLSADHSLTRDNNRSEIPMLLTEALKIQYNFFSCACPWRTISGWRRWYLG